MRIAACCCRLGFLFDRSSAIKLTGMSEKAYTRAFNLLQNGLGFKWVFPSLRFCFWDSLFIFGLSLLNSSDVAEVGSISENWQCSLGVLGLLLQSTRAYLCKICLFQNVHFSFFTILLKSYCCWSYEVKKKQYSCSHVYQFILPFIYYTNL